MRLLLIAILTSCTTLCQALSLAEQVQHSQVGDYLVTRQGRCLSLLLVRDVADHRVTFEEITLPEYAMQPNTEAWAQWLAQGAPQHTAWLLFTVDTDSGHVERPYSFSQQGWLDSTTTDQFLSTLMTLNFSPVSPERRRRVGPPATMGREELRRPWNPPLVMNGQRFQDVPFEAYEAIWPKDGSQLAGRTITIYLPQAKGEFPTHFPYWIDVQPAIGDHSVRVVDSGKHLASPRQLPHSNR